jgi:transcription elongation GreA/GreB family factor
MEIINEVFEQLTQRQSELKDAIADSQAKRIMHSADGDLSENDAFEQESLNLENLQQELDRVEYLLKSAEIVFTDNDDSEEIELGTAFEMIIKKQGNFFNLTVPQNEAEVNFKDTPEERIWYDGVYTYVSGKYKFGGPTDICAYKNILASDSTLAKQLLGKSLSSSWAELIDNENGTIIQFKRVEDNENI